MQDVVFAAFFVVHDELDRDPRAAGPFRIGRGLAIATEVARVTVHALPFLSTRCRRIAQVEGKFRPKS